MVGKELGIRSSVGTKERLNMILGDKQDMVSKIPRYGKLYETR